MALIAILTSVISASYYLRVIVLLVTVTSNDKEYIKFNKAANPSTSKNNLNHDSILTNTHSFLISTLTLSILLFIFKPTLLLNSTQLLSLSLFNY
jgi:NADH-ubiquinone oxidoreductase chain 2